MNYRFDGRASEELFAATRYYEMCREGLGGEFLDEVEAALAVVIESPSRWPEVMAGIRKYRLRRFPYALLYRQRATECVEILVVLDLRRRPGYWRNRA